MEDRKLMDPVDTTRKMSSTSCDKSKRASPHPKLKSRFGVLYMIVITILVEFGRIITKTNNDKESNDNLHCDSKLPLSITYDKADMITASKLHSMLSDALAKMSLKKHMKNLFSEMLVHPQVSMNAYPVYGPGVGPAIDLFLSSATPPTRQELMANESLRLCTFHNYPSSRMVSCVLMAKVGLYYNGHNDEVTCYSCDKSISGWNLNADPYKVHKEHSPDCNHLRGMDTQMMYAASQNSAIAAGPSSGDVSDPGARSGDVSNPATATKSATAAIGNSTGSKSDTGYDTGSAASDFVETAGSKFGGSTAGPTSTADNTKNQTAISENSTRSSGSGDRNSMPSSNSNSLSSHSESNSHVSLTSSGTNSKISQDTGTHPNNIPSQPVSSPTTIHTPVAGNPGNPNRSRAFYPDYVLKADRLKTFDRWPADIHQTPQQMLKSGFFYAGYEDCVRCFQCGIGLRNWEPPDNPDVEHARWSPRCAFLLQEKGPDFINLVLDAVAQLERRTNNPETAQSEEPTTQTSNNNVVTTTTETLKQKSSNSGQQTSSPSITPSGTPSASSNPTSTASPSRTSSAAPKDTATAPSAGSAKSGSSSPQKTMNGQKNSLKKDHITYKSVENGEAVTASDKTKGTGQINKDMVHGIIKQNTPVRKKQPGLFGGGDGTEELPKEELQRIKRENREMRERTVCKICLEDQVSIAFIPCGHLVACSLCAHSLTKCAVCRKPITNKILTDMNV